MPYLGSAPTTSSQSLVKQDFSVSATTSYTLSQSVTNANDIALFINNVRQEPTTAYSASGTSLTLTEATAGTDDMYCVYIGRAVGTINPANGSVGIAQLSATGTKNSTTFLRGDNSFAEAGGGKILQVVQTFKTDTFSTTSGSFVDITGMTLSITPASSSNKILIRVVMQHGGTANMYGGINVLRDSTHIGQSTAVSLSSQVKASFGFNTPHSANGQYKVYTSGFELLDTPSTTNAITYKLQVFVRGGETFNLNRPNGNQNDPLIVGGTSSLTAQEVSA